jgi:hypothetical protein
MLFKEIIAVYTKNRTKSIYTKYSVIDCKADGIYSYRSDLKG